MSLYFLKPCRMSMGSMSHVKFKKLACRPVKFKGQAQYRYYRECHRTYTIVISIEDVLHTILAYSQCFILISKSGFKGIMVFFMR